MSFLTIVALYYRCIFLFLKFSVALQLRPLRPLQVAQIFFQNYLFFRISALLLRKQETRISPKVNSKQILRFATLSVLVHLWEIRVSHFLSTSLSEIRGHIRMRLARQQVSKRVVGLGVPEMGIWFKILNTDRKYLIRCEMKK